MKTLRKSLTDIFLVFALLYLSCVPAHATISGTTLKSGPYTCNSSTTSFSVGFAYIEDSDLVVQELDVSTGGITTLALTTDYTVTDGTPLPDGTFPNGTIHTTGTNSPCPTGDTLTISRALGLTQSQAYPEGGLFPSAATEQAFDRLTLFSQQQQLNLNYALQFPTVDSSSLTTVLPPAAQRANNFLMFDGSGNATISSLGTFAGATSITTLGTITTGTWNGTTVGVPYGGTGDTTLTANGVLYGNGTSGIGATSVGTANYLLTSNGSGSAPTFQQLNLGSSAAVTGTLAASNGGTGVSNTGTITLGGNLTTSGAYTTTLTETGNTNVTLPTSGTLITSTGNTSGSAADLSISGQTGLLSFTGITSTNRTKTVRDAADTLLELGGTYTPTGTWNWGSASVTWPTFNQNTTGSAGSVAASAITGTTLASGVTASSLTSFGSSIALGTPASGNLSNTTGYPKATNAAFGIVEGDGATLGISSGVISCTTGTTSQLGCLKPDGTIITDTAGAITVPKSTASVFGVVEPDNTTITASGGVLTAVGAAATAVTVGTTTVGSGTNTYVLYNNNGVLGNEQYIPAANGGTGISTSASTGVPSVSSGTWSVASTLGASLGGSGVASPTAHYVMVAEGSSAMTPVSPTTNSGYVLTSNGTSSDPSFQALPSSLPTLGYNVQTSTYAPTTTDQAVIITSVGMSGASTWTLTSAATLGNKWWTILYNPTAYTITLKSSSGTIDGIAAATGFPVYPGEQRLVQCDGTNFHTTVLQGFVLTTTSGITFTTPPGYLEFFAQLWGGGGGGYAGSLGGGGGGGGYNQGYITAASMSTSQTITIGAGGSATTSPTAGGETSIGSLMTAYGGGKGAINGASGGGGGGGGSPTAVGGNASGETGGNGGGAQGSLLTGTGSATNVPSTGGADGVGGGGGCGGTGGLGGSSVGFGGGGGSCESTTSGGNAIYGGGGGCAGVSIFGGAGGTSGSVNGAVPGGGGCSHATTSGTGGGGEVIIRGFI